MNAKRNFGAVRWRLAKYVAVAAASLAMMALAGCSGSATPQLIGSYPRNSAPTPVMPAGRTYSTALQVEVPDVDAAAQQATQLAYSYGGYLAASQSWYQDNRLHTLLNLAVPGAQFDALRRSIAALGRLVDEHLTSQPVPWPPYSESPQAMVSVTFTTAQPASEWPGPPDSAWNPARVYGQAFAFFTGLFLVLIDVIIWVSVVAGPFVLMGLGLRWLIRRGRRQA